ncbi:mCG147893 [Mus musculus]|nr:mCG147893 [Mus musculus]
MGGGRGCQKPKPVPVPLPLLLPEDSVVKLPAPSLAPCLPSCYHASSHADNGPTL